jgi:predicted NUDIX family NTP pyrophosphohydrolase
VARKLSAGLLLHRRTGGTVEVLVAHMGGPFWMRRDDGAWSIPKGEYQPGDDPFTAAKREFEEELGSPPPALPYRSLGESRQPSGKLLTVWSVEADFDASAAVSNTFAMEWPRGSGRLQSFPEIDRADWFDVGTARTKLLTGQVPFLDRLVAALGDG